MSAPDLNVIYADDVFLAADKPAGLLVHGDGTGTATLMDAVAAHLASAGRVGVRPQAVQRLDVDTTGLVLFSLDPATQPKLDAEVAGRDMRKVYLAVVAGRFPWAEKTIDAPIGRDRHDARRMRAAGAGQGKPAQTRVRKLAFKGGRTLLKVELVTGRRHQIRVHLASLGFPIVGDALYGGARADARRGEEGLLLHAYAEELAHPATGEPLSLKTDWPSRLGASWSPVDLA
ncbi:RluA family pseudouridine synthase [Paratractidigestivibacter sp.]|uniref:RluA family pseudouridine synthase n=1 Tax=Paratractidigestivibacter sp. TaxID=2847316 RepID=UPI002AC8DBB2|nr:RluA family pseudouridine synthase [Paratractidigestivibacter sp.]